MGSLDHAPRHTDEQRRRFIDQGLWNDDTLATYLEKWARLTPDKPAIVAGERVLSYAATHAAARRLANSLLGIGLAKGDVVGIQLPATTDSGDPATTVVSFAMRSTSVKHHLC